MNRTIRITVSLLLSAFILLGGSGLIIGKMVCLKSGHTVFAAREMKDCCDKEDSGFTISDQCCDISHVSFQQNDFLHENQIMLKAAPVISIPFSASLISFCRNTNIQSLTICNSDVPPDLLNSSPQSFLRIFRI